MIMTLPGMRGASAVGISALEVSAFSASALPARTLGGSTLGISSAAPCSGTSFGDSTLVDPSIDPSTGPCIEVATGSPCASDELGAAGPAPTEPDSPLIGSACCSLTSKSPVKVDLLVTFIACEIVTGS